MWCCLLHLSKWAELAVSWQEVSSVYMNLVSMFTHNLVSLLVCALTTTKDYIRTEGDKDYVRTEGDFCKEIYIYS